jgi:hypothetical protein
VPEHDRVIVDVHDAGLRRHALRDLVCVVGGREAGPEIEELTDAGFGGQVARRPAEESPVGAYPVAQSRVTASTRSPATRSAAKLSLPPSQ